MGGDGVGLLPNGTRVFALGTGGMLAERAVVAKNRLVPVPAALGDAPAAALPNAVAGAAMALRFRAGLHPGETVLINGATGVTGRVAVQLAKLYGARKVIATGRNPASLQALLELGADEIISLEQPLPQLSAQLRALHAESPLDVIIDYLWGSSAELLLDVVKGSGSFTHRTRFVSVGSMLGDTVQLSTRGTAQHRYTPVGLGPGQLVARGAGAALQHRAARSLPAGGRRQAAHRNGDHSPTRH